MQISRIRLSDKTSRLHPRHVVPKRSQADEPEVPVRSGHADFPHPALGQDITPSCVARNASTFSVRRLRIQLRVRRARHAYEDEKREALEKWAAALRAIVAPTRSNVVTLRAKEG